MNVYLQFLCEGEGLPNNGISVQMENQCLTTKKGPQNEKFSSKLKKIVRNHLYLTNVVWGTVTPNVRHF